LKTNKSHHYLFFPMYLSCHLGNSQNMIVAKVHGMSLTMVENIQGIIHQVLKNYRVFGEKGFIIILTTYISGFFLQAFPNPVSFHGIRVDVKNFPKSIMGLSLKQQPYLCMLPLKGFKDCRQQPSKTPIKYIIHHQNKLN